MLSSENVSNIFYATKLQLLGEAPCDADWQIILKGAD